MQGDGMIKGNGKNIIAIILIFILTLFIFIIGVEFFQPNTPYNNPSIINKELTQLFHKLINSEGRENWLIPIGTFCSALSAFATVYLIWLQQQTIKKHDLEVKTERVISHFFILLDKHRTIINNLIYQYNTIKDNNIKKETKGYASIEYYILIISLAYSKFNTVNLEYYVPLYGHFAETSPAILDELSTINYNRNLSNIENFENITYDTFKILDKHTLYCLTQYFNNTYIMLKLLYDNKKNINFKEYMQTLRAEFTQDEFLLIYYYAFIYKEKGEKKFKNIIEETCFFKDLHKEKLDCDPDTIGSEEHENGIPFTLYARSAFEEHN